MEKEVKEENEYLKNLIELEDLAEKKTKIYSRLLIDASLAGKMEELSARHKERRESLERLLYGRTMKDKSNANEGGKYAANGKEGVK